MTKRELGKRYLLFVVGLFFTSLGIAFTKWAALGVSPVSSAANIMNLRFPMLSMGMWLLIWNCLLIVGQILILRKRYQPIQLLQLPLSILSGYFTDLCLWFVSFLPNDQYLLRLLWVVLGVAILGFGVGLTVIANVILQAAEGIVKAISDTIKKDFAAVKICFDVGCVILSVLLSLILFQGQIIEIREGMLIAAFGVGLAVKVTCRLLGPGLERVLKGTGKDG